MVGANARAVVDLARDMADLVPFPPGGCRPDPVSYQAWEDLMLTAGSSLAGSVGYDENLLDDAVGPTIQVGVNPPWRVLLQIAQLEAEAHNCRGGRGSSTPISRRVNRELTSVHAVG